MGISGIFKEIGPGERESLIALSAAHQINHSRPFRLAIDTSIWLFQIQASKGGSNPALRTFYYRLLRLLAHNIHPLFVFDGPNKPTFKRNKKVGGPGVRVASVPEFLAKQLLKEFGFPWHVAPGEAEAECAVLQREGVVDAVMSEDVDTLMFGSGVTVRNWTPENKGKVPTHVNVYRAEETKAKSGLDRDGMILVAMMSGGDYIVEGIPGCGPRVACDAARAGFGKELCEIAKKKDVSGLGQWKERLQREINTNESKFFTRKNKLVIPEDFPSREVLGYYTDPCVSTPEKIERLRDSLQWDQCIDYVALRNFTADAFDWRCISGAKKFVRNLAPALLARELRLRSGNPPQEDSSASAFEAREQEEKSLVSTIHSKRTHPSTDNSLEYRISFTPMTLVPIDLSVEDEDDDSLPAGGADDPLSEADNEWATLPASTPVPDDGDVENILAAKTRGPSLYDPTQPEKLWMMRDFLRMGCPLMVKLYEDGTTDPKALLKSKREARIRAKVDGNIHPGGKKLAGKGRDRARNNMPANALMAYTTVLKSSQVQDEEDVVDVDEEARLRPALRELSPRTTDVRSNSPKKRLFTTARDSHHGEDIQVLPKQKSRSLSPRTSKINANGPLKKSPTAAATRKKDIKSVVVGPTVGFRVLKSQWLADRLSASQPVAAAPSPSLAIHEADDEDPTPKAIRQKAAPSRSKVTAEANADTMIKIIDPARPFAQFAKKDTTTRSDAMYKSPSTTPVRRRLKRSSQDEMSSARSQRTIESYFSPRGQKAPQFDVINLVSSSPTQGVHGLSLPSLPLNADVELLELEGGFSRDAVMELPPSVTKRKPRRSLKRAKTAPVRLNDDCDEETFQVSKGSPRIFDPREGSEVEAMDLGSPSPVRRRDVTDNTSRAPVMGQLSTPLREVAPSPRRSPRLVKPARASCSSLVTTKEKSKVKPLGKQRIQLRESLLGAWKFVDAELDLTEEVAGGVRVHGEKKIASWRRSGVEVLDLTED